MAETASGLHPVLAAVTDASSSAVASRAIPTWRASRPRRRRAVARARLGCTNLAHAFAASRPAEKDGLKGVRWPNLAIVSAYNDMLSAHQPLERYPALIKRAAREAGAVAQFAGGVPAMCDGVTQGQPGMELSLFSSRRDRDGDGRCAFARRVRRRAVPRRLRQDRARPADRRAGVWPPADDLRARRARCPRACPTPTRRRVRREYAEGKVGREALLEAEIAELSLAGHLHVLWHRQQQPVADGSDGPARAGRRVRDAQHAVARRADHRGDAAARRHHGAGRRTSPVGRIVDERAIANAIVALLATGGSTNHTIHLVAIAHAAGIRIDWNDFDDAVAVVPLLARVYPNGNADVNQFQAAGGTGFVIRELLAAGLLHADVATVSDRTGCLHAGAGAGRVRLVA